jgi:hypothetical protein
MRRREKSASFRLPTKLSAYNAADWEGRDDAERYGEFVTARYAWKDARGIVVLPDDEAVWTAFPDGEFRIEDI